MSGRNLLIEKVTSSDGTLVSLAGEIEASFDAAELVEGLSREVVVLDLDGVKRITSFGVRGWVEALKQLDTTFYCFTRARPAMVAQLNMVAGFAGRAALVSLYLPYVCDDCDTEFDVLLDLRAEFDVVTNAAPPPARCPSCGSEAEFDDTPDSYFFYASQSRPPPLPAGATRLIDGEDAAAPRALSIQKEVDGRITAIWLQGPISKKVRFKRLLDGLEGTALVVMQGITDVDADGVGRVRELLALQGAEVYLARLPIDVLEDVREPLRLSLAGRVVSLSIAASCARCGLVVCEADAETVTRATTTDELLCPACGDGVSVAGAGQRLAATSSLFALVVPDDVRAYLAAHTGGALAGVASSDVRTSSQVTGEHEAPQKYEVIRKLGTGGMAEVYLARQRGPQGFVKRVALKTVLSSFARNKAFTEMFLQEARIAAAITHPNVVQIFDLGQDGDRYFIAMEYVRGWDLRTVLSAAKRQDTRLPVELACRISADLTAGLHAAHSCVDEEGRSLCIVHRDVSPHNVLLSDEGGVKITDFGVSKVTGSVFETRSGQIKGKVMYMAPEQVDSRLGPVDARTDVFAAGLLLHEMLAGFSVFRRHTEYDSIGAVLHEPIPGLSELRDDIPTSVSDVVARAVERDRAERYQTAHELHLDLHAALMSLSRPSTPAHLAQWLKELAEAAPDEDMTQRRGTTTGDITDSGGTSVEKRRGGEDDDGPTVILDPPDLTEQD